MMILLQWAVDFTSGFAWTVVDKLDHYKLNIALSHHKIFPEKEI